MYTESDFMECDLIGIFNIVFGPVQHGNEINGYKPERAAVIFYMTNNPTAKKISIDAYTQCGLPLGHYDVKGEFGDVSKLIAWFILTGKDMNFKWIGEDDEIINDDYQAYFDGNKRTKLFAEISEERLH